MAMLGKRWGDRDSKHLETHISDFLTGSDGMETLALEIWESAEIASKGTSTGLGEPIPFQIMFSVTGLVA